MAAPGDTLQTPVTPMELPVEVEIELAPAASLKSAPLWKEIIQLLKEPSIVPQPPLGSTDAVESLVERRPSFTANDLPPLKVWPLNYNYLTAEPARLRTSDGEISWDQPGPMFDPEEVVPTDAFNVPLTTRSMIGALVSCSETTANEANEVRFRAGGPCQGAPLGSLVVSNPPQRGVRNTLGFTSTCTGPGPNNGCSDPRLPPHRTVVGVRAVSAAGVLQELDGTSTTATVDVAELEIPVNEEDFYRPATDTLGVPAPLTVAQPGYPSGYVGRLGAEVLGKALFWDMQVGSDGVQSCGSCHFHAGVDNRTKGQLNPNTTGGDTATLNVHVNAGRPNLGNQEVVGSDFPFHKLANPDLAGEGDPAQTVLSDANDVMSSMGVSRFKLFNDIPLGTFLPAVNGVAALAPDIGTVAPDPVTVNEGFRRVEPRNTPTMHAAAFNLDNFWDGRARFAFNGGSVFGPSDPEKHIFIDGATGLEGTTMGHIRPDLLVENPELAAQPVRIKFSSLGSQSVGPPLSDFEMSFSGRNWAKIGKKLLQLGVTPLANQLVATTDSRLGPFSNQGGAVCAALGRPTLAGKPGLCATYEELIELAYAREYWQNGAQHLNGAACADPFDGYCLTSAGGAAAAADTNQFRQREANFSTFFALAVQAYEELLIPDDTPMDRFMDANPFAANGIGQPGEQAVLFPTLIPDLVDDGVLNGTSGTVTLIPDDPATPEYDGFGPEELFGFDIFAGGNLTAALPAGSPRNPEGLGSNPFTRNARCMLCHLGPEQTDHSINVAHGILKGDAEFEFPTPPSTGLVYTGPGGNTAGVAIAAPTIEIPSPEPPGPAASVGGLFLADEFEETPQDAVEVEPRGFAMLDDPATSWDDRIVAQPGFFAFGDQGIYNVGLRPSAEDIGRGGDDPFGWPLSASALTLKNIGGQAFDPCDSPADSCVMADVDPGDLGATFEETGEGLPYPGTLLTLQSINPGFERDPIVPQMPEYMAHWINGLPAGELHPEIDEMAGFAPNTLTPPNGGPAVEFPEALFGADVHCGVFDPAAFGAGAPNFGWGPVCPNNQSGVTGNFEFPVHGSWPVPNRVLRDGAFKAPQLRNVEMTGPYFHTGSFLTLRQVVDFYLRAGDFPVTNQESRDPNLVDVSEQAFGFGRVAGDNLGLIDHIFSVDPPFTLVGNIADALPDTVYLYDAMPDTDHPLTPEPATTNEAEVKNALVKFLLSLTDPRVKYERAPFDKPEMFVPVDGLAPENTLGAGTAIAPAAGTLTALSSCSVATPCTLPGPDAVLGTADDVIVTTPVFRHIAATGAEGMATPLPNFLGVASTPVPGPNNDHFDP